MRRTCIAVSLLLLPGIPCWAAPSRPPTIVLVYATAETTTSAEVVWNTDVVSDSLVQYSIFDPVPTDAPRIYLPAPVGVPQVPLEGLRTGSLYHFKVTSCAICGLVNEWFT